MNWIPNLPQMAEMERMMVSMGRPNTSLAADMSQQLVAKAVGVLSEGIHYVSSVGKTTRSVLEAVAAAAAATAAVGNSSSSLERRMKELNE